MSELLRASAFLICGFLAVNSAYALCMVLREWWRA